jgi:hypothetical protein
MDLRLRIEVPAPLLNAWICRLLFRQIEQSAAGLAKHQT